MPSCKRLISTMMLVELLILSTARAQSLSASRRNVLVVLTDDLDRAGLERMVAAGLMPHVKSLKDRGVTFLNSFASNPVCGPSRATFLTGQYSHNNGVLMNRGLANAQEAFDNRHRNANLAVWMQQAGYFTGHIGKYLNGYAERPGTETEVPPGYDEWHGLVGGSTYLMWGFSINHNGKVQAYPATDRFDVAPTEPIAKSYQTDVLSEEGARFLARWKAKQPKPFFLVMTPVPPHSEVNPKYGPVQGFSSRVRPAPRHRGTTAMLAFPLPASERPNFNEADVSDKPLWVRVRPPLDSQDVANLDRGYHERLESMRGVDDLVGNLLSTLQDMGELSRTVVIFTADNGFFHGEHRLTGKQVAYEESLRVPLIIMDGARPVTRKEARYVVNTDLAPTVMDIAGAVPTPAGYAFDGRSLAGLVNGGDAPTWRKRFLFEHYSRRIVEPPTCTAVRTSDLESNSPQKLYVEYPGTGEREFYDLVRDPFELRNLHRTSDPALEREKSLLRSQLGVLRQCGGRGILSARNVEDF